MENEAVPVSRADLAREADRAVRAGARAVHVHPRDPEGVETLSSAACAAAVVAIRTRCPGVPVGLTTAAWIEPDPKRRLATVEGWEVRPDFA